ncbi:unnamed protein product, partial [Pylaiella littoralis]
RAAAGARARATVEDEDLEQQLSSPAAPRNAKYCTACDKPVFQTTRPSFSCRGCRMLFHGKCAGYDPRKRQFPPPDWICPRCPDGERGPNEEVLHPSLRGLAAVKQPKGSMPWCPVCLRDNRGPSSDAERAMDIRCHDCGFRPHPACWRNLQIGPDGKRPCVECQRRRDGGIPCGNNPMWLRLKAARVQGGFGHNPLCRKRSSEDTAAAGATTPDTTPPGVASSSRSAASAPAAGSPPSTNCSYSANRKGRLLHRIGAAGDATDTAPNTPSPPPPRPYSNGGGTTPGSTHGKARPRKGAGAAGAAGAPATGAAGVSSPPRSPSKPHTAATPATGTGSPTKVHSTNGKVRHRKGAAAAAPRISAPNAGGGSGSGGRSNKNGKRNLNYDGGEEEEEEEYNPRSNGVRRKRRKTTSAASTGGAGDAAANVSHSGKGDAPEAAAEAGAAAASAAAAVAAREQDPRTPRKRVSTGAGGNRTVCQNCKRPRSGGQKSSGVFCGSCGGWWHNSAHCAGANGCPESGKWVGGWRCRGCLSTWEKGLKDRAAKVVEAWAVHEARREQDSVGHRRAAAAAAAESEDAQRYGFAVNKIEVPPVTHPPAGILPFLDVESVKDRGFRLARLTREDCCFMGPDCVVAKVDLCWKHRIFAIIEGAFDPQIQPLMDFLGDRKGLPCKISGKAASGEASSTMGDYRSKLADHHLKDKPQKESPGTFFLDTASGQVEVLNWLPTDPLMGGLMPEAERGGLLHHLMGERCKFGPFTFGGGRNFPFLESADACAGGNPHAAKKSQRQYMQGKRRDRIGGSTTHMDGMGSFTAIGGIKAGMKSVTAFESEDCGTALAVAKFKAFAKPGGSSYVVNDRIDDDDTLRNRLTNAGVRYRTFPIREGEAYLVPSGCLHEFMNVVPCLSVAWNIMPHPANCNVAMDMAEASAREAEAELGVNTDRSISAIEHAPPESMRERQAAWVIKTWLQRGTLLRRRWAAAGHGSGAPAIPVSARCGGRDRSSSVEARRVAGTMAAKHTLPRDMWKRFLFLRPRKHYYEEVNPVYDGQVVRSVVKIAVATPAARGAAAVAVGARAAAAKAANARAVGAKAAGAKAATARAAGLKATGKSGRSVAAAAAASDVAGRKGDGKHVTEAIRADVAGLKAPAGDPGSAPPPVKRGRGRPRKIRPNVATKPIMAPTSPRDAPQQQQQQRQEAAGTAPLDAEPVLPEPSVPVRDGEKPTTATLRTSPREAPQQHQHEHQQHQRQEVAGTAPLDAMPFPPERSVPVHDLVKSTTATLWSSPREVPQRQERRMTWAAPPNAAPVPLEPTVAAHEVAATRSSWGTAAATLEWPEFSVPPLSSVSSAMLGRRLRLPVRAEVTTPSSLAPNQGIPYVSTASLSILGDPPPDLAVQLPPSDSDADNGGDHDGIDV